MEHQSLCRLKERWGTLGSPRMTTASGSGMLARMNIANNAVLLVIDVQKGMDDPRFGRRNNARAETNVARLLEAWRTTGRPIIHVQHDSPNPESAFRPGKPGNAIKPEAQPQAGEPVVHKNVSSAFIGTDLEQRL